MFLRVSDDSMKNLGIGVRSLTLNLLEKLDPDEESKNNSQDEKVVKGIAGVLCGGGSDLCTICLHCNLLIQSRFWILIRCGGYGILE